MPIVEYSAVIAGPIEKVFDLSQSYALRLEWDPFVRSQRPLRGATVAARGVHSETVSRHHLKMVTEYLTFKRPTLVGMKMVSGPPIFRTFSGSWRFVDLTAPGAEALTEVFFRYNFACSPQLMAPLMEWIGKKYLGRDIEQRLAAFKRAIEHTDILERLPQADQ